MDGWMDGCLAVRAWTWRLLRVEKVFILTFTQAGKHALIREECFLTENSTPADAWPDLVQLFSNQPLLVRSNHFRTITLSVQLVSKIRREKDYDPYSHHEASK